MKSRFEQEKVVIEKWNNLINELSVLLEIAKKGGGTIGHKVGSMRDKQIELRDNFK